MSENDGNWWRNLEAIFKPVFIIATLIVLFFFALAKEADAETAVEVGATFLSGEYSKGQALIVSERFDKYSIGLAYLTDQTVTDRAGDTYTPRPNLMLFGQRNAAVADWLELGVGVSYYNATNRALGSRFTALLTVQFLIGERFTASIRHSSNAGSASPNMGQDMLLIGYRF